MKFSNLTVIPSERDPALRESSRKAAEECSPGREPRVRVGKEQAPKGAKEEFSSTHFSRAVSPSFATHGAAVSRTFTNPR